jgi:hypothetical protein
MSRGTGGHRYPMRGGRPALSAVLCGALLSSVVACAPALGVPNERALWQLWQQHATNAVDHEELLAACKTFTDQNPADPLLAVGQTLAAWNLLCLGRQVEAATILVRHLDKTGVPLEDGAAHLARSWMTRLDRERVKAALQFYYRREVRYPRSLDELAAYAPLPKELALPGRDRWGTPWRYALVGFKTLPGLLDQKYEVSSAKLGPASDLARALAVPYGDGMRVQPTRMLSANPGGEIVELMTEPPAAATADASAAKPAGRTFAVGINSTVEGICLSYVGRSILIVHDNDHWKLLMRPAAP